MRISLFLLLLFCVFSLYAQTNHKISPNLKQNDQGLFDCVIMLDDQADITLSKEINGKQEKGSYVFSKLLAHAKETQRSLIEYCKNEMIWYKSFYIMNALHVRCTESQLNTLSAFPEVRFIHNNTAMRMHEVSVDRIDDAPSREPMPEWGIRMIKADSVWLLGYSGQGVVVGGQDTGYDWQVSPLKSKYRGWDGFTADHNYNWHDAIREKHPLNADSINPCGYNLTQPCDDNNHGTHTMGTMVGSDSSNYIGVAPSASWIACRNMERGWGLPTTYLECFEWFLAPTDTLGLNPDPSKAPHVINNSWACPPIEGCDTSNFFILENAVKNLKAAGTVVVVSAGNSGPQCNTISDPAAIYEASFSVGATRSNDTIWNGSSRGLVTVDGSNLLKPNVTAPGAGVRSVIRDGNFASFTGTSMAGPHVAGLVALMISANPKLAGEVDAIEDIIENTAVKKWNNQDCTPVLLLTPNPVYGYGRVDALAAVKKALEWESTSIKNTAINEILVYPNPSSHLVNIESKSALHGKWSLIDYSGKHLQSGSFSGEYNYTLDLSSVNPGMYVLHIMDETAMINRVLVKI